MAIKVFISHKQEDARKAKEIADHLWLRHNIDSYLDVLDPVIGKNGEELARYVRDKMGACTQLLAVITPITSESWWVPWEIGVASEKELPLATYTGARQLPDYMMKWPVLRNDQHLDAYANASKVADQERVLLERTVTASTARHRTTQDFYRTLRKSLGQY